jgi:Flp pilus assembly pilin Flp
MISHMRAWFTARAARVFAAYQTLSAHERGASIVEYVMVVTFIAMVAIFAVALAGQALDAEYDTIADSVANYGR